MLELSLEAFESLVADAMDGLPEPFASHLDNVMVVVEQEPRPDQIAHLAPNGTLFGLYEGVPQTERGQGYTFVLPDKITIFRRPILSACDDLEEVTDQVITTVIHEIAHHFGISDARLVELGWD